jgi:CDP-diacylglycerol--serine O-phosphatidyltransferase
MFGFALYAGLTMVTNVPFYSFKDVQMKKSVPFAVIVLIALGHRRHQHPSAHCAVRPVRAVRAERLWLYGWRSFKGQQTSVISTSTDEPEERGLHK